MEDLARFGKIRPYVATFHTTLTHVRQFQLFDIHCVLFAIDIDYLRLLLDICLGGGMIALSLSR